MAAIFAPPKQKTPGMKMDCFDTYEVDINDSKDIQDYWENPERVLSRNIKRFENGHFESDVLPVVFPNFGASGQVNYYGSEPEYKEDTIWFDHIIDDLNPSALTLNENRIQKQIDTVQYYVDKAESRYFVGMPDNGGSMDALASLRGNTELLMDLIANPEGVLAMREKLDTDLSVLNKRFYDVIQKTNGGGVHSWMNLLCEGTIAQMQSDMSVMISPEMYGQFVAPEIQFHSSNLDYPVYHFDGIEQIAFLDHILAIDELKVIQWTHCAGQLSPSHYIEALKKRYNQQVKGLCCIHPMKIYQYLWKICHLKACLYIHMLKIKGKLINCLITSVSIQRNKVCKYKNG